MDFSAATFDQACVIPTSFYQRPDVHTIAKELLGKALFSKSVEGDVTGGVIIEVESYAGETDRACHVYGGKRTRRTEAMYGLGGIAYVYLCYGIHHLLNVVTHLEGTAEAILIRALHPTVGIETMIKRRAKNKLDSSLTSGPGALCKALGINLTHYGKSFHGPDLWITDCGINLLPEQIEAGPRIGVAYAREDALLPYRYCIKQPNQG